MGVLRWPLFLVLLSTTCVVAQDLPEYTCLKANSPIIIDGVADEAAWQQADPVGMVDVSYIQDPRPHSQPTEVRMLWDDDNLYVLFVATDPDVWSRLTERDDPLWNDEVVEIFFDPTGESLRYAEIEVNSLNTIVDLLVTWTPKRQSFFEWSPELRSAVTVDGTVNDHTDEDRRWVMEIAIPWSALQSDLLDVMGDQSLPPREGDVWRFNFYRYERLRENGVETEIEYSAWSPTGEINFHMPERFGLVTFRAALTADDLYPPGSLVPTFDLGLQQVEITVPDKFRDEVAEGLTLNLPPGFSASVFSAGRLVRPRFMAFSDDGVMHLADMNQGVVIALPDRDKDGVADSHIIAAEGFRYNHSLAFYKGDLYVGDTHQVLRLRDPDGDLVYEEREVFIDDIPSEAWHTTRTIVFDERDEKIYLGVGSPCDLCRPQSPVAGGTSDPVAPNDEWTSILEFNIDGTGRRIFATGVRNAVGLTLHPITNELWGDHNGHDLEGRAKPAEWIDIIRDGDFMGYPFVHGYQVWNDFSIPRYQRMLPITPQDSLLAARQKRPVAQVPAHYAPMGIHFYTHDQFPEHYKNQAFVAFRAGQAKLSSHPGYMVAALFSEPDGSNARMAPFITGFQAGTTTDDVWGFPVGLMTDDEGSLYVTSDARNRMVLKITHSPLSGSWEHDLPKTADAGSSLDLSVTVHVERRVEDGGPVRVRLDLSELGGPAEVALAAVDEHTFRLDTQVQLDVPSGVYRLRAFIEQTEGLTPLSVQLLTSIAVLPRVDFVLLDDSLADGWRAASSSGALPLRLTTGDPARAGRAAAELQVEPSSAAAPWELSLLPSTPFTPAGLATLYFSFHPGDLQQSAGSQHLWVLVNGRSVDLLAGHIDLSLRRWQDVEIPLADFTLRSDPVQKILFTGDLSGTFYLDDLRFRLDRDRSPIAALWEQDLLEAVTEGGELDVAATVHVTRVEVGATVRVTADLSALGGPAALPLTQLDDDTYRLDTHLDLGGVAKGEHHLFVRIEQETASGRQWVRLSHTVTVLPQDLRILDDGLATGWQLTGNHGAEVLGSMSDGPVYNGQQALAVHVKPENFFTNWQVELLPPETIDRLGFAGLRFALHAGGTEAPAVPVMVLYIGERSLDLLRPERPFIDPQRPGWQIVEVSFDDFGIGFGYGLGVLLKVEDISSIRLQGNLTGTVYLDDVRLVTGIPSAPPTQTAVLETEATPAAFALGPSYPNPFNAETVIRLAVPQAGQARLAVYNLAGQRVVDLLKRQLNAGQHLVHWHGRDDSGRALASGVYLVRFTIAGMTATEKILLLR
jgi:glucose/arabinose dehydrogenase